MVFFLTRLLIDSSVNLDSKFILSALKKQIKTKHRISVGEDQSSGKAWPMGFQPKDQQGWTEDKKPIKSKIEPRFRQYEHQNEAHNIRKPNKEFEYCKKIPANSSEINT